MNLNRIPTAAKGSHHIFGEHLGIAAGHIDIHVAEPLQAVEDIVQVNTLRVLKLLPGNRILHLCSCQVRNKKKLIFFINGEPLARFPMLLLYNFVFSLLLLIIPSSSLKVIKVPSDFNMLIIIHQHIINEISDYFFIKLIQLTKLC